VKESKDVSRRKISPVIGDKQTRACNPFKKTSDSG